ncbi:unnamed protein product [Sphenostylis stenocarpa]|uniref:Uncharacterized protein n=1 Tax=Sphenostylis stenocarpa TaxID=92480 RepID=A0AA86SIZ1_9FABA|nr:unnamed protein product [Sphenostylis stenocarpa]
MLSFELLANPGIIASLDQIVFHSACGFLVLGQFVSADSTLKGLPSKAPASLERYDLLTENVFNQIMKQKEARLRDVARHEHNVARKKDKIHYVLV